MDLPSTLAVTMRWNVLGCLLRLDNALFFEAVLFMTRYPLWKFLEASSRSSRLLSGASRPAGRSGDDAHSAKSGELPPKALVRVDAIRKARLTNLDCAQDCLFTEVEHPVHKCPICDLVVGRGIQAIAGNHGIPQRSLLGHFRNSRHRKRLCGRKVVEGGELIPQLSPAIDISVRYVEDFIARFVFT
jgi:hypothetical protein